MRLKDKVSLITGAGSGIGQAVALRFASEGAIVVIADRNLEAAEKTQYLIEQTGGTGHAIAVDVTQEQQVVDAIATTIQQFGRLDVLHNNAGISILKPITETTEADWDLLFNINLKGVFFGCKHAIPPMVQQGGGVIINTASELAIVGQSLYTAYCATKGGVLAFTRALSVEWAAKGIRINAICPGPIQTPMLQAEFNLASNPTAEEVATIQSIPVGRLGAPDDIARVALFLASDDAVFVHGAAIVADGGRTTL
ncbi:SDR family oxidoreductase [Oscillatoria sp. FACHB-1407]|uniref:SDR family NAD(P)-dependent oxidoreductase n=1 Tax=Oscillatoria sp. FACHB-1407 TaxID=2692847 RepID=UPI0016896F78|nr:SDR family NAD(P)-dependent oxidoreductase [Oscillatoria sp. FACHB-1407]MBD2463550.1 SDR family oxidoreductase [Oscillatoria sp. FACHB-1407]